MQDDDFFLESIYRRFDAAIDRIDSRARSPTIPHRGMIPMGVFQIEYLQL
jgi:hypothetical protein